jgi:hypothetical protein
MHDSSSNASRRTFLHAGLGAAALTALPNSVQAQQQGTVTPITTPMGTTPITAPTATAVMGEMTPGDIAIFRFSLANEMIGGDLWSQYGNQVLYNPQFAAALRAIDPMLPRYVLDTVRDELSHGAFLTALASALGIPPVNLDAFRTLPDAGSAAATGFGTTITDPELSAGLAGIQMGGAALPPPGTPRLVNLQAVNVDTSFFNKYRTANNPDVQPEAPPLIMGLSGPTIPTATGGATADNQRTGLMALMHMSMNEQLESSTYIALGSLIRNREMLRLMASILPVEMMHYTAFQTSLARSQGSAGMGTGTGGTGTGTGTGGTGTGTGTGGTGTGTGTGTDPGTGGGMSSLMIPNIAGQGTPIPLPVLPAPAPFYAGLPPVSVVRPSTIPRAGAVATAQKLAASNIFAGQPPAFLDMMMQMARAADAAGTVAVLGPQGMQTNEREIALSTMGSMSGIGGGAILASAHPRVRCDHRR